MGARIAASGSPGPASSAFGVAPRVAVASLSQSLGNTTPNWIQAALWAAAQ